MSITPNEYQTLAARTAIYPSEKGVEYCVLGMTNEAGEVAGKLKKYIRDSEDWDHTVDKLVDETGDVLWYAANLLKELGVSMEDCMERNVKKLQGRQNRGTIGGSGDVR